MQVLVCQLCGGQRRIIGKIDDGPVARKILAHLGLATEPPVRAPARAADQLDAWETGPPGAGEPEASFDRLRMSGGDEQPPAFEYDQRLPGADLFV